MAALVPFIPYIVAGAGMLIQGDEANRDAKFQAMQLERQAGQERAVAQLEMGNRRRSTRYAQSRAQALAAASGAGASDPTVVNLIAELEGEGEFGALAALYEGEERARGMETGAKASRASGRAAQTSSYLKAGSTLLAGGTSWYDQYGGGGPPNTGRGGTPSYSDPTFQQIQLDSSLVKQPRWR